MLICLHLGAHRTAGGFMRARLLEQRGPLRKLGFDLVSPWHVRQHLTDPLNAAGRDEVAGFAEAQPKIARSMKKLVDYRAGRDCMIMSDDDVAGPPESALDPRGLYPAIGPRLRAVIEAAPAGHEVKVLFVVRGYADFFNALFVQRRGDRSKPLSDLYRSRGVELPRGWADVARDVCAAAGPERTVVWTYEDFARDPDCAARAFFDDRMPEIFAEESKVRRVPVSRKGLAVLDRTYDMLSEREFATLAGLLSRYGFEAPDRPFSLFDAAETAALDRRYAADLAAIRGLGCRLMGEAAQPVATLAD